MTDNIHDAIKAAALGAFAVFCTPSPSFVAYQRAMKPVKGRSYADRLFGIGDRPCAHQIRTWLDPVAPAQLFPVFAGVYDALESAGHSSSWRVFTDQLLLALNGTAYVASHEIHGDRCSQRTHRHGAVTYVHQVIPPVMVAPGKHAVIPLEPEFITPPDGHEQQDGAQVAAKRWMAGHANHSQQVTI